MRFSDFADQLLVSVYDASRGKGEARKLKSGDVIDAYGLSFEEGWVHALISDWSARGYTIGRGTTGDDRSQPIYLAAAGMREAERLIDMGVQVNRRYSREPEPFDEQETPSPASKALIDSQAWTGVPQPHVVISEGNQAVLITKLNALIGELDTLPVSNAEKAQARALATAALHIAEAPEPQWDIVWTILQRMDSIASIGSFVLAAIALFVVGS